MAGVMTSENYVNEGQSKMFDWPSSIQLHTPTNSQVIDAHVLVTVHQGENRMSKHFSSTVMEIVENVDEWCTSWASLADVSHDLEIAQINRNSGRARRLIPIRTVLLAMVATIFLCFAAAQWMQVVAVRNVLTGSMKPAINPGDIVLAVNDDYRTPKVGDVVLYRGRRFDGTVVATFAHRIIGGNAVEGWVVKGDANESEDVQRPMAMDIIGVVVATLPSVGKILTPQLFLNLGVGLIAVWFLLKASGSRA